MTDDYKKRCTHCKNLIGYQSFSPKSDICKRCVDSIQYEDYKTNGTIYKTKCSRCGETKNKFFWYRKNGNNIYGSVCSVCKRKYMAKRGGYELKLKCVLTFVMDGKQMCTHCDNVLTPNDFNGTRAICKTCLRSQKREKRKRNKVE